MRRIATTTLLITLATLALVHLRAGAEPEVRPEDLPRTAPTEPHDALTTFAVRPGFRIELVASEPLVVDPIAMCFDENGRLFVVEMRDYPLRRDERLGRIRMLEDLDGDGRFDKSTVFLDNLPWPTAVFYYGGGVLVGAAPDLLYAKDTTGDGVADDVKVLFTGFAEVQKRLNVQTLLNNLNWGLDNRIHGCSGIDPGFVVSRMHPDRPPMDLRGKGFVIDPRDWSLGAEHGGGQYGLSFDPWGRLFTSSNSDHIQTFMYDMRYAGRNPHFNMPQARVSIAADGPAAEVFRISPEEPWRVIRTRWRIAGLVRGVVEGGGRSAGYFTGATGVTIYRGDAFGPEFVGNAFVGDAGGNLVHRKRVRREGVSLVAERAHDEKTIEFCASSDTWFRPVNFANGPDGALYVMDMYREVIEHPWSIPDSLKQHLDLNSGDDRGRIYRIVPEDFVQRPPPRLGSASTAELVELLAHPNGWHRDTASRLIFERQDRSAIPLLANLLATSPSALGRLHAMYALHGMNALEESHVLAALRDEEEHVRAHAIALAEGFFDERKPSTALWSALVALAEDSSPIARYQLALTLGELEHPDRTATLARIIRRDVNEWWTRAAVLNSLDTGASEVFAELAGDESFNTTRSGREFLSQLAMLVGAQNREPEIAQVIEYARSAPRELALATARGLADGATRAASLDALRPQLKPCFTIASEVARDSNSSAELRATAIALLGYANYEDARDVLLTPLRERHGQSVQLASIAALERFREPRIAYDVLQSWDALQPRARSAATALLLKRKEWSIALLESVREGALRQSDLDAAQVNLLLNSSDSDVRALAHKILVAPAAQRSAVLESFRESLSIIGDAQRGRALYEARCISCHRAQQQGFAVGPDIESFTGSGPDQLLLSILDPNREVSPNYVAYHVQTTDGESYLGLITSDTPTSITILQPYGREVTLPRSRIRQMTSAGKSLMPEGLEAEMSAQDMADLLEFITSVRSDRAGEP